MRLVAGTIVGLCLLSAGQNPEFKLAQISCSRFRISDADGPVSKKKLELRDDKYCWSRPHVTVLKQCGKLITTLKTTKEGIVDISNIKPGRYLLKADLGRGAFGTFDINRSNPCVAELTIEPSDEPSVYLLRLKSDATTH